MMKSQFWSRILRWISLPLSVAVAVASLACSYAVSPAAAQDGQKQIAQGVRPTGPVSVPTNVWAISRGGQVYDEWWALLEKKAPTETHPAYPAAGKQKGANTWRCKECHGWDYKGVDGAYAKGSHFTGIKGVRGVEGVEPARIVEIIKDKTHRYTDDMISISAMEKLALFLSLGQIDMDRYIDRATKKARGDPLRGAQFFQTICANCHGYDGKELNFGDEKEPEYVGTVGTDNPWEALHKIRFGQPGFPMVALGVLEVQTQVDILAYMQTLPTK
jgi:thiosulfate dehydrogenase